MYNWNQYMKQQNQSKQEKEIEQKLKILEEKREKRSQKLVLKYKDRVEEFMLTYQTKPYFVSVYKDPQYIPSKPKSDQAKFKGRPYFYRKYENSRERVQKNQLDNDLKLSLDPLQKWIPRQRQKEKEIQQNLILSPRNQLTRIADLLHSRQTIRSKSPEEVKSLYKEQKSYFNAIKDLAVDKNNTILNSSQIEDIVPQSSTARSIMKSCYKEF